MPGPTPGSPAARIGAAWSGRHYELHRRQAASWQDPRVVTLLAVLGVLVVLFATAVLVTRGDPLLADAPPDSADLALPDRPLRPDDVAEVRLSLAPRGYRMSEVDAVLARLAEELADRDRRLGLLEAAVDGEQPGPRTAGPDDLPLAGPPAG